MENRIFRQKSIEQISSTDELHEYMHVTSPKLWMILSVILALVIGFIVFASTVSMENIIKVKAESRIDADDPSGKKTSITIDIPKAYESVVKPNMDVKIGAYNGHIGVIGQISGDYSFAVVFLDDNEQLPVGTYDGEIILEQVSPISFLFN